MSGGANEFVAAYNKNGSDKTHGGITNGLPFADGTSDKYSTAYDVNSNVHFDSEISRESYKYGDAIYETRKWHSDGAEYITIDQPFFNRGGAYINTGGIFTNTMTGGIGAGHAYISGFRVCLIV